MGIYVEEKNIGYMGFGTSRGFWPLEAILERALCG